MKCVAVMAKPMNTVRLMSVWEMIGGVGHVHEHARRGNARAPIGAHTRGDVLDDRDVLLTQCCGDGV